MTWYDPFMRRGDAPAVERSCHGGAQAVGRSYRRISIPISHSRRSLIFLPHIFNSFQGLYSVAIDANMG